MELAEKASTANRKRLIVQALRNALMKLSAGVFAALLSGHLRLHSAQRMTNYSLKPPDNSLPRTSWQEAKEKRKKLLEDVRRRRAERYKQFLTKLRLASKQ